ncbi:MAG: ATP-binding protein [Bacteroidota bacterium]
MHIVAVSSRTEELVAFLKSTEALRHVPQVELEWLVERSQILKEEKGNLIFQKDNDLPYLLILIKGKVRAFTVQNGSQRELAVAEAGSITGVLPYSRMQKAGANVEALEDCEYLRLHQDFFPAMIQGQQKLVEALVHVMLNRVRNFTTQVQRNDKLMALGKLSAGLAHELNNPASAIVRSAHLLKEHLGLIPNSFKKVISIQMEEKEVDAVNDIIFGKLEAPNYLADKSLLEKAKMEQELIDWLYDHECEEAEDMIESFLEFGICEGDLDRIAKLVPAPHLPPVINWLNQVLTTEKMVREIQEASVRINGLITAMKDYSYMDQSHDRQTVDLHTDIYNTLTILKHKIKQNNIQVEKDFQVDLPAFTGLPGELNQVWTNIIDNALDAMEEGGKLTIITREQGSCIRIQFIDTGNGIPQDAMSHIFEPFFTTKTIGQGLGLGLDTVMKVLHQHEGDIKVSSRPGHTEFRILIPINK